MSKDEMYAFLQGGWETRDGGEPTMTIVVREAEVTVDGEKSLMSWNDIEEVWVIEAGINLIQLIPNENDTLTTISVKNGPFPALSFPYNRVE